MSDQSFREQSRNNFQPVVGPPTNDQIKVGCLQRIADATELMAKNYIFMQNELDRYKRWYEQERKSGERMARRIAALQGVITKKKKGTLKLLIPIFVFLASCHPARNMERTLTAEPAHNFNQPSNSFFIPKAMADTLLRIDTLLPPSEKAMTFINNGTGWIHLHEVGMKCSCVQCRNKADTLRATLIVYYDKGPAILHTKPGFVIQQNWKDEIYLDDKKQVIKAPLEVLTYKLRRAKL